MKPYYENSFGKMYQGNCLDIMKELDMKFDLVLTDPPYNTTDCKWDKEIIDLQKLKNAIFDITERYANFVVFGNEPFSTKVRNAFSDVKDMIVYG